MPTVNQKFAQLQPFLLAGSGAIIGDTSITLQSMLDINGNLVTMSDFGNLGFGTIEPGNGSNEEQICFTGVSQNPNGTATLTGVSTVLFVYPYTQTSGLAKTHAGSTTFIISNTSGFYNELASTDDDETITGLYTFTNPNYPQINTDNPEPTLNTQFVPKSYVDNVVVSGAPNANPTTKGIVQIATQAQVDAKTIIGSTSAYLVQPLNTQRSTLLSDYVIDTSTSPNIIIITPSPAITSYQAGQQFSFKLANTNTSPTVTLNVNGLGAQNLSILSGTTSPSANDLISGGIIVVEYDGVNFQVQTPTNESQPTGMITMFGGSIAPTNWLLCNGSPVSRITYATLFSVIGTSFGNGNGTTTFNVPNMGGYFVAGPSPFLSNTIGATGGSATQTITVSTSPFFNSVTLNGGGTSSLPGTTGGGPILSPPNTFSIIPPYIITNYIIHI